MAKFSWHTAYSLAGLIGLALSSCASPSYDDAEEVLTPGTISFPFSYQPEAIGREGPHGNKLVVKSIAGKSEYVIELPDEGDNYAIEVPTATFSAPAANPAAAFKNPSATDRELVNQMPELTPGTYQQRQQLEQGLGLSEKGGPGQSPSYIAGLAEINDLYRKRELELALVKANNLIIHYPNSGKLHKMKGTLLIKLRNYTLAQRAWAQAARLDPQDGLLKRGLLRLEQRIEMESKAAATRPPRTAQAAPPTPPANTANAANSTNTAKGANTANAANANAVPPAENGANAERAARAAAAANLGANVNNGTNGVNANNGLNAANGINAQQNAQEGMTTRGFSDGLAPRNVPDDPRNALRNPERNTPPEENLANPEPLNGANGGNTISFEGNTGSNLFDGDPDTRAAARRKPPNEWRNNGSGNGSNGAGN